VDSLLRTITEGRIERKRMKGRLLAWRMNTVNRRRKPVLANGGCRGGDLEGEGGRSPPTF